MQPDKQPVRQWQPQALLVGEISPAAALLLAKLPEALERVWPLSRAHRRQLPADIRDLSAALTSQRSELRFNYWKKPNWISAYLYYFLPWNLVRLCGLLPGLPLPEPARDSLLADAGSGPLTMPLALWLAKPEWRKAPVTVLAMDASRQPLEIGQALFAAVAELAGQQAWTVDAESGPLENLGAASRAAAPWLATAANVLNELKPGKDGSGERFERLLAAWQPLWTRGAPLLFVEPGTRLGGAMIMRLRAAALERGLYPLSPCTHNADCPLPDRDDLAKLPSGWCHFVFSAQNAPAWLKDLSREARLFKTSLSLSFILLADSPPALTLPPGALPTRVISQSFLARMSVARYGCASCGLCFLRNSKNAVSGSLCLARRPQKDMRDEKSGALVLEPFAAARDGRNNR